MSSLYYNKLSVQSAAAQFSTQAGYPASNVLTESLQRPCKTSTTGGQYLTLTYAANQSVAALFLHDINFVPTQIEKSADGVTFTVVSSSVSVYRDKWGRYRVLLVINDASVRAIRVLAGGVGLDGLTYYRVGAAYTFGSKLTLPVNPDYPLEVRTKRPRVLTELPNGLDAAASTGLNRDFLNLRFRPQPSQDLSTLLQQAALGTCVFDMEHPSYPHWMWPVRFVAPDIAESHQQYGQTEFGLELRERV